MIKPDGLIRVVTLVCTRVTTMEQAITTLKKLIDLELLSSSGDLNTDHIVIWQAASGSSSSFVGGFVATVKDVVIDVNDKLPSMWIGQTWEFRDVSSFWRRYTGPLSDTRLAVADLFTLSNKLQQPVAHTTPKEETADMPLHVALQLASDFLRGASLGLKQATNTVNC